MIAYFPVCVVDFTFICFTVYCMGVSLFTVWVCHCLLYERVTVYCMGVSLFTPWMSLLINCISSRYLASRLRYQNILPYVCTLLCEVYSMALNIFKCMGEIMVQMLSTILCSSWQQLCVLGWCPHVEYIKHGWK